MFVSITLGRIVGAVFCRNKEVIKVERPVILKIVDYIQIRDSKQKAIRAHPAFQLNDDTSDADLSLKSCFTRTQSR